MEVKKMRQILKSQDLKVPRSNADVKLAYKAYKESLKDSNPLLGGESPLEAGAHDNVVVTLVSSNMYTYIGSGDSPPEKINFMGKQKFVRGELTEVTNSEIIKKIINHPCFVKGKVTRETLDENVKREAKIAAKKQEEAEILAQRKAG